MTDAADRPPARRRRLPAVAGAVLVLLVGAFVTACGGAAGSGGAAASGSRSPSASAARSAVALAPSSPTTDLPVVRMTALPEEAVETLGLIAAGGPFPYSKDGATFGNREGELPRQRSGFYREYTVETPGSADRGARRIVTGSDGSRFYTDDHYESFREVIAG